MAGAARPALHRLGGLAQAVFWVFAFASAGAAGAPTEPSRDARSVAYCSQLANIGGFYDTDLALACRREEYTAAARARELDAPPELDQYCDSLAAEGDPIGPFSWRAYVDCLDGVLP